MKVAVRGESELLSDKLSQSMGTVRPEVHLPSEGLHAVLPGGKLKLAGPSGHYS